MPRENSPFEYGGFWLDKRRDGRSPDTWQIASYADRSVSYRSTRTRDLEAAKGALIAHVQALRSRGPQAADEALVVPQLLLYHAEHGQFARSPHAIAASLRIFIGFLMADEVGAGATMADLKPALFERFRRWRMGPHAYAVPWNDRIYEHTSSGVRGESVQTNLGHVRAAFGHAVANDRIPYAPRVANLKPEFRSPPRDVRFTIPQLGAMIAYAWDNPPFRRWLLLMVATAARPNACLAFDPATQWHGDLVDLHPPAWPRTKKRNPILPLIEPMRPHLADWLADPNPPRVGRFIRPFRTMRSALDLPAAAIPKTVRHTIATELRRRGVTGEEIETVLGHRALSKTTEVYAKYDPNYLKRPRRVLATIFREVMGEVDKARAVHLLSTVPIAPPAPAKRARPKLVVSDKDRDLAG